MKSKLDWLSPYELPFSALTFEIILSLSISLFPSFYWYILFPSKVLIKSNTNFASNSINTINLLFENHNNLAAAWFKFSRSLFKIQIIRE